MPTRTASNVWRSIVEWARMAALLTGSILISWYTFFSRQFRFINSIFLPWRIHHDVSSIFPTPFITEKIDNASLDSLAELMCAAVPIDGCVYTSNVQCASTIPLRSRSRCVFIVLNWLVYVISRLCVIESWIWFYLLSYLPWPRDAAAVFRQHNYFTNKFILDLRFIFRASSVQYKRRCNSWCTGKHIIIALCTIEMHSNGRWLRSIEKTQVD